MNKKTILGLFVVAMLFLSACNIDPSQIDLSKVDTDKIIKCEAPYIRVGAECCVDQDNNKICDKDEIELEKLREGDKEAPQVEPIPPEEPTEESCEDECSSDSCSGFDYTECLMKSDGCKDKNFIGKTPGKCGVECTTGNDCTSDKICKDYKCILELVAPEEEPGPVEADMYVSSAGFNPAEMKLKFGDTITIGSTEGRHKLTIGGITTPVIEEGTATQVTFNTPGRIRVFDIFTKHSTYVTVVEDIAEE